MPRYSYKRINVEHIKAILNTMYQAKVDMNMLKSFKHLKIVQRYIKAMNTDAVGYYLALEYAVQDILSNFIENELHKERSVLDIAQLYDNPVGSRQRAIQDIQQDAATISTTLIAWSLLYHVHVRPDLNISYTNFAQIIPVDTRTVRRYKNKGIQLLTYRLIRAELQVKVFQGEEFQQLNSGSLLSDEQHM